MHRKKLICGLVGLLVLATGTLIFAQMGMGVLKGDMSDPAQVVSARKEFMHAIQGNMGDLNNKLKAGHIKDMAANGTSIAALATALPVLFKETYKEVYPVKGSATYYKGADPAEFEAAADKLRSAGMAIMEAAQKNDKAGVSAGMEALKGSCGGCHSAFRGKY